MDSINVETWDLDEAAALLRDQYTARIGSSGPAAGLHIVQDSLDSVFVSHIRYVMQATLTVSDPIGHTYITRMRDGLLGYQMHPTDHLARQDNQWTTGDLFVAVGAGGTFDATLHNADVDFAAIDPATFAAVAETPSGEPVALTGYTPVSPGAARSWMAAFRYAQQVAAQPAVAPLVSGATARLLAANALGAFPNNAVLHPTIEDRHDAHPQTLRHAVAFIETNPDLDLSVADIARASYVGVRAVQLAFRRHLDTTPLAYLRRVRMAHAREDLVRAGPDSDDTVTAIVLRWGFANTGDFSARYRATYGELPRDTLRN